MSEFKSALEELKYEQQALEAKKQQLRYQAINEIQHLITEFNIHADELSFDGAKVIIRRKPSKIKYKLPNGVTWTGKGNPKKELVAYLTSVGETLADLPKYKVD